MSPLLELRGLGVHYRTGRGEVAAVRGVDLTLEAGDVILTGTPGGTGVADGRFLMPGDVITVTVENIGTLTNTIAMAAP